jgi:PncC family amidohydrolase
MKKNIFSTAKRPVKIKDMFNTLKTVYKISRLLRKHNLTISTAESCTGGLLASRLTDISGSSSYFKTGFITYNEASKLTHLGIDQDIIEKYGTVSKECAKDMAERVRSLTASDIGLATTGNLGPETIEGKPKGQIYMAISLPEKTLLKQLNLKGPRVKVKIKAVEVILKLLYKQLCLL